MAEIYLARQEGVGDFSRLVVVKRILPHLAEELRFIEMFLEEARLASLIQHPNVVQIYDVDQQGASYYIAMEYIDGVSLGSICRRARKRSVLPSVAVSAEIVAQACAGLHAAHELRDDEGALVGLVHRDISPHNLMIAQTGVVKLVDFGIAKAKTTSIRTRTGDIKGKYPYMSPEQIRAEPLDRRTDIFSLGAILAELVLGQRFFDRSSELATMKAITEEPIATLRELDPDQPEPISQVVERAMRRRREDRFQTAAEMGAALRAAIDEIGERTSPQTVADYLERDCQELLEARSRSVRDLAQMPSFSVSTVPKVEGFEESAWSGDHSVDEADQTRPIKKPSEEPSQPSMPPLSSAEAPARGGRWRKVTAGLALVAALGILVGALTLLGRPSAPSGPPLYYAHPPTYAEATVKEGFAPLVAYLERQLDRPVEVVVSEDYGSLRKRLLAGELDVANLSPLLFVQARHQSSKLRPLASHTYEGARTYQSYIIVGTDSDLHQPGDLRGKRFCYVDSGSTSGFLLPRHFMREQGIDPEQDIASARYSGSHTEVMRDIVAGRCDAGAVYSGAFASAGELGVAASRLRLLAVAGQTPWDVICASPQLPAAEAERIQKVLLEFDVERELGRPIVSPIFRIDGFLEPQLEDFEPIAAAARAEGVLEP